MLLDRCKAEVIELRGMSLSRSWAQAIVIGVVLLRSVCAAR